MNFSEPTKTSSRNSIALLPKLSGLGGPTSFQQKIIKGFEENGIPVHFDPLDPKTKAVLVNGGSKHLFSIWKARNQGKKIVQRLDGMNWMHRKRDTGIRHYLRSEYGNWNLAFIRKNLANHIIYQSNFSKNWWESKYGPIKAESDVIYNGVDLDYYTPDGPHLRPNDHIRVLLVEGHFSGGHELGLLNAIRLVVHLSERFSQRIELMVVGDVPDILRMEIESVSNAWITWAGVLLPEHIPGFDRSSHFLFSADLNAACPNSVIEAIACGLPVVAYATGSLPEIIQEEAGKLADYGADYWKLEPADIPALSDAALKILQRLPYYRKQARLRAESIFSLKVMVERYAQILVS